MLMTLRSSLAPHDAQTPSATRSPESSRLKIFLCSQQAIARRVPYDQRSSRSHRHSLRRRGVDRTRR